MFCRTFGLVGPESIVEDENGNLYTGLEDGRIVRIAPTTDGVVGSGKVSILTDGKFSEMTQYLGAKRGRPLGNFCSHFSTIFLKNGIISKCFFVLNTLILLNIIIEADDKSAFGFNLRSI